MIDVIINKGLTQEEVVSINKIRVPRTGKNKSTYEGRLVYFKRYDSNSKIIEFLKDENGEIWIGFTKSDNINIKLPVLKQGKQSNV